MFSFLIQILLLSYLLYILLGGRRSHTRSDDSQRNTRGGWQNGQDRNGDGWGSGGSWQNAWESYYRQYAKTQTDNSCAAAYRVLGVQQSASIDEIKAAYRKLAIKFHPDKYATQSLQAQKDAEQKFKEVNEAYDTIKKARNFS